MVKDDADGQSFMSQLTAYVKDSLPKADRAWMDQYLNVHPEAQDELAFERMLHRSMKDVQSTVSMVDALAKFKTLLIQEQLLIPPATKKLRKHSK